MRIAVLLAALAMTTAAGAAVTATRSSQGPDAIDAPRISMPEFKQLVAAKRVVVVDTRNPDEFKAGHMAGALFLPLEGRLTWPEEYEPVVKQLIASTKPVVTYCA
jgi:predicted sulfurtransferase